MCVHVSEEVGVGDCLFQHKAYYSNSLLTGIVKLTNRSSVISNMESKKKHMKPVNVLHFFMGTYFMGDWVV